MELLYYNVQQTCIFHDMKEWTTIKHWQELKNNPNFQYKLVVEIEKNKNPHKRIIKDISNNKNNSNNNPDKHEGLDEQEQYENSVLIKISINCIGLNVGNEYERKAGKYDCNICKRWKRC